MVEAENRDDPRMRFRVWVDAELIDEAWLDMGNPEVESLFLVMQARHGAIVESAEKLGQLWMVETYDPAKPEDCAYMRAGTDCGGMIDPRPIR